MEACIDTRKRLRDQSNDSPFDFLGSKSKFVRFDSPDFNFVSPDAPIASDSSDAKSIDSKQVGIIPPHDSGPDYSIRDDLLNILDEADACSIDRESAVIQDLESVIRSFEKEIQVPAVPAVQPELGYLLEASDDELGLPPAGQVGEMSGIGGMKGFLGFEDDEVVPNYCWEENLRSESEWKEEGGGEEEVVALGGLFDHTDVTAEVAYRSETMSCL